MKKVSWGYLWAVCQKLQTSPMTKFNQTECDAFFRSPVWAFVVQQTAFRIASCFSAIGDVNGTDQKKVELYRHDINNSFWVLQLETYVRKFIEEELSPEDMKAREDICRFVLERIPISDQRELKS